MFVCDLLAYLATGHASVTTLISIGLQCCWISRNCIMGASFVLRERANFDCRVFKCSSVSKPNTALAYLMEPNLADR